MDNNDEGYDCGLLEVDGETTLKSVVGGSAAVTVLLGAIFWLHSRDAAHCDEYRENNSEAISQQLSQHVGTNVKSITVDAGRLDCAYNVEDNVAAVTLTAEP